MGISLANSGPGSGLGTREVLDAHLDGPDVEPHEVEHRGANLVAGPLGHRFERSRPFGLDVEQSPIAPPLPMSASAVVVVRCSGASSDGSPAMVAPWAPGTLAAA